MKSKIMYGKALKVLRTISRREVALYCDAEQERHQAEAAETLGSEPVAEVAKA